MIVESLYCLFWLFVGVCFLLLFFFFFFFVIAIAFFLTLPHPARFSCFLVLATAQEGGEEVDFSVIEAANSSPSLLFMGCVYNMVYSLVCDRGGGGRGGGEGGGERRGRGKKGGEKSWEGLLFYGGGEEEKSNQL